MGAKLGQEFPAYTSPWNQVNQPMTNLKEWMTHREQDDRHLYDQYGKPLEKDHTDEYVAIGPDGRTVLGTDDVAVLKQAIDTFGSGNFALCRVGHRAFGRWLTLST